MLNNLSVMHTREYPITKEQLEDRLVETKIM